jgi:putative endopeptidase
MIMTMRFRFLLTVLLVTALAGAAPADDAKSKAPHLWRGIDVAGMDLSRKPWEDFYQFANGKWIARADIPPDRPSLYVFTLLADRNRNILHQILEKAAADHDATGIRALVGAFYRSGMDEAKIEAAGAKPLQKELDRLAAVRAPADILPALARLHLLRAYATFHIFSSPDAKDSTRVIAELYQGGLGLPDREYYLKDDARTKALRAAYLAHVGKMLTLLGEAPAEAGKQAQTILAFETRLAKASRTRVALRDPHRNYHLMSIADLEKETPGVPWGPYFKGLGLDGLKEANVGQPAFIAEIGRMVKEVPAADWQTYLRWHLLNAYASALGKAFVAEDFHFKGTVLTGIPRNRPRWERVVEATDRLLGEPLGQLYVARAFPPAVKTRAEALVANVKATLRERLATLDWMSPKTRQEALRKLDAIAVKVGYPSKWRDFSGLKLPGDVYANNVMAARVFQSRHELAKIGKKLDRSEWEMTPPTVNAYYNPNLNEIVFPAGILQPPFFDPEADDALNYGAIGMVIGHELTHGFDDQGRKYDADGNLRDWWAPQDERNYKERAALLAGQYAGYLAVDDLHVNGELTLGENIADLGGLKISFLAFQKTLRGKPAPPKVAGFTPEQRFFLSYAQVWRGLMRPEALRLMVKTNPHSPPRFRVVGPLYNMPEFFRAFAVSPEDARGRLNPRPVEIW